MAAADEDGPQRRRPRVTRDTTAEDDDEEDETAEDETADAPNEVKYKDITWRKLPPDGIKMDSNREPRYKAKFSDPDVAKGATIGSLFDYL